MPSENFHHRKDRKRYSVVFVPDGESAKTKTFSIGKIGISFILAIVTLLITVSVVAILMFTPVGKYLPIQNREMDFKYSKQITGIQNKLNSLLEEMIILRQYNMRLRRALGEKLTDSAYVMNTEGRKDSTGRGQVKQGEDRGKRRGEIMKEISSEMPGEIFVSGVDRENVHDSGLNFFLTMPVAGYISRGFDPDGKHFGIDFVGKNGSPVYASADGYVIFADWTYEYGYMVMIAHAGGYITVYKHNQAILKYFGSIVRRGEPIALLGNTGITSHGSHIHFELWHNGTAYDPNNFLLTAQ